MFKEKKESEISPITPLSSLLFPLREKNLYNHYVPGIKGLHVKKVTAARFILLCKVVTVWTKNKNYLVTYTWRKKKQH